MSRIIDTIKVKPAGLFASWRYKQVLIDDNGNVSTQNVPGKESINLPCLSSYKHISRSFKNGQLVTEFCNFETFANFRIYAQDCDPFVSVESDPNAAKCGYMEQLPEPAVPSNPFGTSVHGLYKTYSFCSVKLVNYVVNIYKKDFTGEPTEIQSGSDDPVVINYLNADKFTPIRSSECNVTLMCNENFQLKEFYTSDERAFRLEVIEADTIVKFSGFIIPDSCREPFSSPPYPVTIRATDGLGALKTVTYPLPVGSKLDIRQSFKDIICYCLAMTNLNLDLQTICNLYEVKMSTGIDNDPLDQATVNPIRLSDSKGNVKNCYEVLSDVCTLFGASISQVDGVWRFVRLSELSNSIVRARTYSYTGLFKFSEQLTNARTIDNTENDVTVLNGGEIRIENAYKRVIVLTQFGNAATQLLNGDFEIWDGQNFRYWTRYGGINISREQKTITGTGGIKVPIQDYAVQFNQEGNLSNSGKWLESAPITVEKGDKIEFSFNFGNINYFYLLKFRFKIGSYWLYATFDPNQAGNLIDAGWKNKLTRVEYLANGINDINYNKHSFTLPEAPESGNLIIQIFGGIGYLKNVKLGPQPYLPIQFDNISISKSSQGKEDEPDGFWSISEQLGFYTNTPEEIVIPFGDYSEAAETKRPSRGTTNFLNSLYAIYTSDGSFSTAWKDYTASGVDTIGITLAKTIVKAYQNPFIVFEGALQGDNITSLDVFNFLNVDNEEFSAKTFALLSGEISLKYHQVTNAKLVEIFSKAIYTTNYTTPHTNGQIPPAITQNPSTPVDKVRVFSNQFTSQFS